MDGTFEVSRPVDDGSCSDNTCGCGFPGATIPVGTGYLFVSPEVVDFRRDARSEADAMRKIEALPGLVPDPKAIATPILMCDQAASARGFDKEHAAGVAREWWRTGRVPLEPTRLTPAEPVDLSSDWLATLPAELDAALDEGGDELVIALIRRHGSRLANLRFAPDFPFESLRGATLLELMVALGRTEVTAALVSLGARADLLNAQGVSAVDLASDEPAVLRRLGVGPSEATPPWWRFWFR